MNLLPTVIKRCERERCMKHANMWLFLTDQPKDWDWKRGISICKKRNVSRKIPQGIFIIYSNKIWPDTLRHWPHFFMQRLFWFWFMVIGLFQSPKLFLILEKSCLFYLILSILLFIYFKIYHAFKWQEIKKKIIIYTEFLPSDQSVPKLTLDKHTYKIDNRKT